MAHSDGEPRPDAASQGRRARREAQRPAHPSTPSAEPAPPSPYQAPSASRPSPYGTPSASPYGGDPASPVTGSVPTMSIPARSRREARLADAATPPAGTDTGHAAADAGTTDVPAGRSGRSGSGSGSGSRRPRSHRDGGTPPAGPSDRRGSRRGGRTTRRGRKIHTTMIGVGAVAALGFAGAVVVTTNSQAETPMTRLNFAPVGTWAWYNDKSLGKTEGLDQYAQASVSGLVDGDHNAGFFLRYADRRDRVRVAVSGSVWRIEPAGGTPVTGEFPHGPSGTFRAEAQGQTVRIIWDGHLVTEQALPRAYTGHAVLATVWQSTPTVRMTNLEASSLDAANRSPLPRLSGSATPGGSTGTGPSPSTSGSASPSPSTSASPSASAAAKKRPAGRTGWFSGAAGDNMASGGFDRWRGTASGIAGTWDDQTPEGQLELYSICGGQYSEGAWDKKLDMAIGAIFKKAGESWEAAASGAYDSRWRQVLTKAKRCWGKRNADDLYLRFGHELNLSSSDWGVQAGQEDSFKAALTRFSNIRYDVFPGVNIVLSVNDGTSGGMADVRKLNPGRDGQGRRVIDVYGADSYNAWPHCLTVSDCQSKFSKYADDGAPLGIETHRKLAQQWGVPFSINEWSNNGSAGNMDGGGEAPAFMQAFYGWAKAHSGDTANPRAGQVLYEVLFNLWDAYHLYPADVQPQTAEEYRSLPWGKV